MEPESKTMPIVFFFRLMGLISFYTVGRIICSTYHSWPICPLQPQRFTLCSYRIRTHATSMLLPIQQRILRTAAVFSALLVLRIGQMFMYEAFIAQGAQNPFMLFNLDEVGTTFDYSPDHAKKEPRFTLLK